jgi:ribosome-associated translation inhibitor RaiA
MSKVVGEKFARLKNRYDEILSATVNLDEGEKDDTPYQLKSTVLIKTKMKDFVATKINKVPLTAIRQSFDAVERQIRKTMDKISHPWEKH